MKNKKSSHRRIRKKGVLRFSRVSLEHHFFFLLNIERVLILCITRGEKNVSTRTKTHVSLLDVAQKLLRGLLRISNGSLSFSFSLSEVVISSPAEFESDLEDLTVAREDLTKLDHRQSKVKLEFSRQMEFALRGAVTLVSPEVDSRNFLKIREPVLFISDNKNRFLFFFFV